MTGKEFKTLTEALARFANLRDKKPGSLMFVQSGAGKLKFIVGSDAGTMIADAGVSNETALFFVNVKPFLSLVKGIKVRDDVTLSVSKAELGVTVNGNVSRFKKVDGELSDLILPAKDVEVSIPHQGLTQAWRMLSAMESDHPNSKHVSLAYVDGASIVAASHYSASGFTLPCEPFERNVQFPIGFVDGWKPLEEPGVIEFNRNRVQIRSGPFLAVGMTVDAFRWPLELQPLPSDVRVTYDRKTLIDAIKGVADRDEFARVTLACTPDGRHHVGRYLGGDWIALNGEGEPWKTAKTITATFALKILNGMEGKEVTLSWDEGLDTRTGAHHIHFSSEGMKTWTIILAPVAMN